MTINCKHCGRYIFEANVTTIAEGVICANTKCKAKLNIKICFDDATAQQLHYKFKGSEREPRASIVDKVETKV